MGLLAEAGTQGVKRDWQPAAKREDIDRARALDAARRDGTDKVTERDLLRYCRRAVRDGCRGLTREQAEDIASELVMATARRTGTWTPRRRQVGAYWLKRTAQEIARDYAPRWRHEASEGADVAGPDSPLVAAHVSTLGEVPAIDADADLLASRLSLSANGHAAVAAALNGSRGRPRAGEEAPALTLAAQLGVSHDVARKLLESGRREIRTTYEPADLVNALADALAAEAERDESHVRLTAVQRAARRVVDLHADTTRAPLPARGWSEAAGYWQTRDQKAPRQWAKQTSHGTRSRALVAYLAAHGEREAPTYPQAKRRNARRDLVRVPGGLAVKGTPAEEAAHADGLWRRMP